MLGFAGTIEDVGQTSEEGRRSIVQRLGQPTLATRENEFFELADCRATVEIIRVHGQSMPYKVRIIANDRLSYERALGRLQ